MALFSRKPKQTASQRPPPVDKVRSMQRSGLSERDIIRQLKNEGYSFSEIEKAMLQSVKEGAGEAYPPTQPQAAPAYAPAYAPYAPEPAALPPPAAYAPAPQYEQPRPEEEAPLIEAEFPEIQTTGEEISPEVVMEDLIESVAQEKFEKFSAQARKLETEFEEVRAELRHVKDKAEAKPVAEIPKEWEDKLDDLEARIGGLERAFRQFLPSLTEHIESLSGIINEMKERKESHSREELMA